LEDLKELQAKLKQMSTEARDKDLLYKQLVWITRCYLTDYVNPLTPTVTSFVIFDIRAL